MLNRITDLYKKYFLQIGSVGLAFLILASFQMFTQNFKPMVAISFFVFLGFIYITEDFFVSLYFVFLLSSFFYFPTKRYSVELIPEYFLRLAEDKFHGGLIGVYGLNTSDIFGTWLIIFFISRLVKNLLISKRELSSFRFFRQPYILLSVVFWSLYFYLAIYSSINFTPYPLFSTVILIQSAELIIAYIATIYFFVKKVKFRKIFYFLFLSLMFFQVATTIGNFRALDLNEFGSFSEPDVEQSRLFSRPAGIIGHPNQDALVTSLLVIILSTGFFLYSNWILGIGTGLGFLLLILYQSRAIWLAIILISILIYTKFRARLIEIWRVLKKRFIRRRLWLLIPGALLILIVIERVNSSLSVSSYGAELRLKMLRQGTALLKMSPIWGFGVENTVVAFFENIRSSYVYYFPVAVHFTPLQVVLESGVPAGLSFFIPYFLFAQKILTIRDKIAQIVVCSGLIFILTFFVFHPLDNWRRDFLIYGLFWGWSGCLLSDRKMIK